MSDKSIEHKLLELGNKLEASFDRINWGGCGEVALMVSRKLDVLGINHDIALVHTYGSKDYKEDWDCADVSDWHEDKHVRGIDRSPPNNHVLIRLEDGRFWDTEGFYAHPEDIKDAGYNSVAGFVDNESLELITSDLGEWNMCFDRSQLVAMERVADEVLR